MNLVIYCGKGMFSCGNAPVWTAYVHCLWCALLAIALVGVRLEMERLEPVLDVSGNFLSTRGSYCPLDSAAPAPLCNCSARLVALLWTLSRYLGG